MMNIRESDRRPEIDEIIRAINSGDITAGDINAGLDDQIDAILEMFDWNDPGTFTSDAFLSVAELLESMDLLPSEGAVFSGEDPMDLVSRFDPSGVGCAQAGGVAALLDEFSGAW